MPVKDDLQIFLKNNLSEDIEDCDLDSELLDYLEKVFCEYDNEEFEFDEISEMLEAYVPAISTIRRDIQIDWLISMVESYHDNPLSHQTTYVKTDSESSNSNEGFARFSMLHSFSTKQPCIAASADSTNNEFPDLDSISQGEIKRLSEIFPEENTTRLKRCYEKSDRNIESAIDLVLSGKYQDVKLNQEISEDISTIKDSILNRYSLVEAQEEERNHKPMPHKYEKVKPVRYLNNQVVDTKGSKYLEIKSEIAGPKPVHLKPLRKYRFH